MPRSDYVKNSYGMSVNEVISSSLEDYMSWNITVMKFEIKLKLSDSIEIKLNFSTSIKILYKVR